MLSTVRQLPCTNQRLVFRSDKPIRAQYWQYEKAPYLDLALGVTEGEGAALTPAVHQRGGSLRVRINNLQKVDFILLNLDIISGWYDERLEIKY